MMDTQSLLEKEMESASNAIVALGRLLECQVAYEENIDGTLSETECSYRADMAASIKQALSSIRRMKKKYYDRLSK